MPSIPSRSARARHFNYHFGLIDYTGASKGILFCSGEQRAMITGGFAGHSGRVR